MRVPTIHTNGTSRQALFDAVCEAGTAIHLAMVKLQETSPNGRDYYPQGESALAEATKEHLNRLERLHSVYEEIQALADAIADGGLS